MAKLGTTNKEVFGYGSTGYSLDRLYIVRNAVKRRLESLQDVSYADPIKVFIKMEPHKLSKIKEGRFRIISGVSVIDSIVDRILFIRLAHKIKSNFDKLGVMIGWSPLGGGYRYIDSITNGKKMVTIDKSHWDFTVKDWMVDGLLEILLRISPNAPGWWTTSVVKRFDHLFRKPIYSFGDGSVGKQPVAGIMKSGCYLTIIGNSILQLFLHYLALDFLNIRDNLVIIAMGDDTLQEDFPNFDEYHKYIESLGVKCKVSRPDKPEFAGFIFPKGRFEPEYMAKHIFKLGFLTTDRQVVISTLRSYQLLYYSHSWMLSYLRLVCELCDVPEAIESVNRLKALADG